MKYPIKTYQYKLILLGLLMMVSATAQEIKWHSLDAGGGISTDNSGIKLIGVIGQADTIRMTAANVSLSAGYLPLPVKADSIFRDSFE